MQPEGKGMAEGFNKAMIGMGYITDKNALNKGICYSKLILDSESSHSFLPSLTAYPWSDVPKDAVVCDVGAGNGHVMLGLLKSHPHLRAVVQDLPSVIADGRKLWDDQAPESVQGQRVDFVAIDFMKESPVKNCDIYYVCRGFLCSPVWVTDVVY